MFETKYPTTWCPGCPNYLIKVSVQKALESLTKQGYKKEDFVIVTDIGCNSKIYDYLDLSGLYGLHGRAITTGFGVKVGNPKLNVIVFAGDGATFSEGLDHFIHACRYNINITVLVHDNGVFSLTTGQASPTSEEGFVEKTHPFGVHEQPISPIGLALESGASFVARASALDHLDTARIIEEAIKHPGFSFIDILQPCTIYHNFSEFVKKNCYKIQPLSLKEAKEEAEKWKYSPEGKAAIGIFFQKKMKTFEEKYLK
ncbi:MAG: thiamine pyrophosphate-dependent enzyme [Candidatus Woesearchaeota archaeon]